MSRHRQPGISIAGSVYIRLVTMLTVSASTMTLKKNETTPCTVVSRCIVLLGFRRSDYLRGHGDDQHPQSEVGNEAINRTIPAAPRIVIKT
jgi:hypothetical protein